MGQVLGNETKLLMQPDPQIVRRDH